MKKYSHIFFDLDRTLWDYDANATQTLHELVDQYPILNDHIDKNTFVKVFFDINENLWSKYDEGLIDKKFIRTQRFQLIFRRLKLKVYDDIHMIQERFIAECPRKGNLIEGAKDMVDKLSNFYALYIITNGFEEVQSVKLEFSGLKDFFKQIITSERAQAQKPDPEIFQFALKTAGTTVNDAVMVGDNFISDIEGARSAGMDQIYFNPQGRRNRFDPTYEIQQLDQLADILL